MLEHVGHLGRRIHSGKKGTENPCAGLEEIVPDNSRRSYDVKEVIACVADRNSFFEVQQEFAPNAVVGFARMEGETVGFVANQPAVMGGSLDYHASDKIARFIRFCDCFGLPILTLVDVPAFCREPRRNTAESSATERRCCMRIPKLLCPRFH